MRAPIDESAFCFFGCLYVICTCGSVLCSPGRPPSLRGPGVLCSFVSVVIPSPPSATSAADVPIGARGICFSGCPTLSEGWVRRHFVAQVWSTGFWSADLRLLCLCSSAFPSAAPPSSRHPFCFSGCLYVICTCRSVLCSPGRPPSLRALGFYARLDLLSFRARRRPRPRPTFPSAGEESAFSGAPPFLKGGSEGIL
jgi:hypothetical protein